MRVANIAGALLGLALTFPGALAAQERQTEQARGFMGIGFEWEDDDSAEARVARVLPGSGAATAGVRSGDLILRIDGQPATQATVDRLRERLRVGDDVRLRLRRDGRELDQTVVAGRRPESERVVLRGDDGEITIRIPREQIRIRMDTVRANLERLHTRMDSLHGRLELLHGDSTVVFRMEREPGGRLHLFPRGSGRLHVLGDSAGHRWLRDSVIVLTDSILGERMDLERALRVEGVRAFPFRDLDPDVPFFMEVGRRSVAGAELAVMNPGLARYFRTERGLLVVQVSENTPMARAGVEPGDVIVRAGDDAISDVTELRRAFSAASAQGRLRLGLLRQGSSRTVEMQWEPNRSRVQSREAREQEVRARRAAERARVRERTRAQERAPAN